MDNLRQFQRALKVLVSKDVLVGVPNTKAGRKKEKGRAMSNATLAYIHNNGSPAANIPARPFMEPGIQEARPELERRLLALGKGVLDGKDPETGLMAVGLVAQNAVRSKINRGPFTPLAESTIKARKRRGRTGTRPLIDTGQLRNAITFVVRKKGA